MRVLMPLPDHDFDVTEVAVPWHVLTAAGHDVVFAAAVGVRGLQQLPMPWRAAAPAQQPPVIKT